MIEYYFYYTNSVPALKTKVTVKTKYCRVADLYNATK